MTTPDKKSLNPQTVISKLLVELGESWLPVHEQALEAVEAGDTETLRLLSATTWTIVSATPGALYGLYS